MDLGKWCVQWAITNLCYIMWQFGRWGEEKMSGWKQDSFPRNSQKRLRNDLIILQISLKYLYTQLKWSLDGRSVSLLHVNHKSNGNQYDSMQKACLVLSAVTHRRLRVCLSLLGGWSCMPWQASSSDPSLGALITPFKSFNMLVNMLVWTVCSWSKKCLPSWTNVLYKLLTGLS